MQSSMDFSNNGNNTNNNQSHSYNNNNNAHHIDSVHHLSVSSKKPSLLSGYHNPFSGTER